MKTLDDIIKEIDPLQENNVKIRMHISTQIVDEIKSKGWDVDRFHRECNALIHKGESNYGPKRITNWISGTYDFKVSELILIGEVLDYNFFRYISITIQK